MVRQAYRVGLGAVALTDHDSISGIGAARQAGDALGIQVLAGCEFSVRAEWGEAHLLAYALPDDDPELNRFLAEMRTARTDRSRAIVGAIQRCGVGLEIGEVEVVAAGAAVGRPHVARALIAKGVVRTVDEAFDRFLGRGRPAFVGKVLPAVETVTSLVRRAGGVTSIAHLKDRGDEATLSWFRARGVDGVEVYHPGHTGPVRQSLAHLAAKLSMLPTGGSDSHGERAVSPAHSVIGGERVPIQWAERILELAAARRIDADVVR